MLKITDKQTAYLQTGEGQFTGLLFINKDLIFRFPPDPVYAGTLPGAIGKVFMGYKKIPGGPLSRNVLKSITDTPFGDPFFARFCKYYSPGTSLQERARFQRGTFALQEALHGLRNHNPDAFNGERELYR